MFNKLYYVYKDTEDLRENCDMKGATVQGRSQEVEMGGGVQNYWARGLGAA